MIIRLVTLLFLLLAVSQLVAETSICYRDCIVMQKGDSLVVENSQIKRVYHLNQGNLITRYIQNKTNRFVWQSQSELPDMSLPGYNSSSALVSFNSYVVAESSLREAYVEIEIIYDIEKLLIKRVIRLYPESPVVGNDFYFKGNMSNIGWYDKQFIDNELTDVRFVASRKTANRIPVLESVSFQGKHWQYRIVSLFEMTDHLNSLVMVNDYQSYNERLYKGNLLFALNNENEQGFFILKESPSSLAQLKYPSADYLASFGNVKAIGLGIDENDISTDKWTRGYSTVFGIFSQNEYNALVNLKAYQSKIRKIISDRDEMIMMNTWGDRGVGKRINEEYILSELELCHRLGITHFQIDDGWQAGKSPATTSGGSFDKIWERSDYWIPDPVNFPKGLKNVVEKGRELGIEICLWFNPSYTDNYDDWLQDAKVLISLNRKYGIRTFKIDGLRIHNKLSEERVDSLLSTVSEALNHNVVFNLDVTADKRFGYFYKNSFGNIFLENRYTDFGNYFPYWTLRNLWTLSKYVPSRNLQIEFLNKWRNNEKYGNDSFAPGNYDFEYLFAITMMAQPLAWMEAHNLPEEAFAIKQILNVYKKIQYDLHSGVILPIGDIPSGKSWTGFQSIKDGYGYFLIFRENNKNKSMQLNTWLKPGTYIELEKILGEGDNFHVKAGEDGQISFKLVTENSYSLYKYKIVQ